jgi:transposase InsO family protein
MARLGMSERIWRREGLKVPAGQPERDRLWLADGSCVRLRPERPNQVWAYDCVEERTRDGRKFRMLCVIDEFTREALAIKVARKLDSNHVIEVLADLFVVRGVPEHIHSDQGPEFVATAVKDWIKAVGAQPAYIEKSSPWENGYVESFNGKLRDELLNVEIFNSLREAQILIESWRRHYNAIRPHSALGYRPPAPEVIVPAPAAWPAAQPRPAPPAMLQLVSRPVLNQHPTRTTRWGPVTPRCVRPAGVDGFVAKYMGDRARRTGGSEGGAPKDGLRHSARGRTRGGTVLPR